MNRKKKINSILKAKLKKANAKMQKSNKPRYISKAEREKLAQQVLFSSERLHMRPLTLEDKTLVLEIFNEPDVLKYIGDKEIRSLEDAEHYLKKGPMSMQETLGFSLYCCINKDTNEKVGISGLIKRDGIDEVEVGFAFLRSHCRKGYGLESTLAVTKYAKNTLAIAKLQAITHPENIGSIGLLEHANFTFKSLICLPDSDEEIKLFERTL